MNADTDTKLDAFVLLQTDRQVFHRSEDTQTRSYCSVSVIFMCLGIAEVHEEPIPKELSNVSVKTLDDFRTSRLIGTDDVPVLFWVELAGEFGGFDQITEHDGELTAFSFGYM